MRCFAAVVSVVVMASFCHAADWNVDPVHSSVSFSVKHVMVSTVKGGFTNFTGTAKYDPANPESLAIEGTIDAASITTGNAGRDNHLRSKDFLNVQEFPRITFKSKELKKAADGSYAVVGSLGLHGVTNAVTLQLKDLAPPVSFNGTRVGFSLSGQIDRDKFGLTWNKAIETGGVVVGNEVKISADIEMIQVAPPAKP